MAQLRVGIVGTGSMARTHAKQIGALPGARVEAVCSRSLERAQAFCQEHTQGNAAGYDNLDRMLDERQLDALYVCLPPAAHAGEVEAAAARGVHLFLEKPIALDSGRGESMTRAVEQAGVVSLVGYHMRFAHPVRRLHKMIQDGSAGRPTLFQGTWFCNALHAPWWRDHTLSGGQVFEQIIHLYDMAMHLLGEPRSVSAQMDNLCHRDMPDYTVEDTSASVIRFTSGAIATIAGSNCAVPTQWQSTFRIVCEKVTVELHALDHATFWYTQGRPAEHYFQNKRQVQMRQYQEPVDCYREENRHFIAACQGKAASLAPIRDGLNGLRLVEAVRRSAEDGGRPVQLAGAQAGP